MEPPSRSTTSRSPSATIEAVRGVSFEVARGEVFGFLGPNGAGKTTTINMLCTLARPTGGSARVAGHDVVARARRRPPPHRPRLPGPDARRLPHRRAEPAAARRALRRRLARSSPPRMRQVLEMVDLWDRRDATVHDLLRRHAAAPGDRARAHALAARAVPRRADDRARPADAQLDLALHPRAAGARGDHDLHDHALHGRGRVLRPHRDHGPAARSSCSTRPRRSRRSVGADRVRIQTDDDDAAIAALAERFGVEAASSEGAVTFFVASGEEFVPRLFAELGVAIRRSASRGRRSTTSSCRTRARRSATPRSPARRTRNRIMMQMMTGGRR